MYVLTVHAKLLSDTEQLLIVNVHKPCFSLNKVAWWQFIHYRSIMPGLSPSLIIVGFLHSLTFALILSMLSCKNKLLYSVRR